MPLLESVAVGVAVAELLKLVKSVTTRCSEFKSILDGLENTLNIISPLVKEIEELSCQQMGIHNTTETEMKPLLDHLKMGENLIHECSKISKWGYLQKLESWNQLKEFKNKFFEFFVLYLATLATRNTFRISVDQNRLCRMFERSSDDYLRVLDSWEFFEEPVRPVGLAQPLKELKMMLLKSEQVVHVLSAPGGSGKTTLTKMLLEDDDVKGRFGTRVFAATVTKTLNRMVIFQKLLKQMQKQASDIEVPDSFQSVEEAFMHFKSSVEKIISKPPPGGGSVLCILDDVWSGSESESLLDKFELQIQGYKVLVTSRYEFPSFQNSTYRLKLLSDEEALELFRHSAFSQNARPSFIREDIENEIVRKCKNNPLALKVIGRSLRGELPEVWISRNERWSNYVFETNNDLLDSLKASLDALGKGDVLKDCFFDLASFPEDSRIRAPALVDMWVELYKLDYEWDVMIHIDNLFHRCLVDLVNTSSFCRKDGRDLYGCYNDSFITQHDILRELAIYLSNQDPVEERRRLIIEISGDRYPEWLLNLKNQTIKARLLSISTDENFTLKRWDWDMKLSRIEVLVLNLSSRRYTLPEFIKKMRQLKVLVITNHGVSLPAELSNFFILGSLFNLRRIRLENVNVPSIFESCRHREPVGNVISRLLSATKLSSCLDNYRFIAAKPMKNLKKISLVMCSIGEAFNNCSAQLSDILPKLEEIDVDYCNDLRTLPSQLCDLKHLTKLSITNCPKLIQLPDRIGNLEATLLVLSLHACIQLSTLPDSISSLQNLTILDISECLSLRNLPEKMGDMKDLKELHMRGGTNISELPASIVSLLNLKNVFCNEETANLWAEYDELQHVDVRVLPETPNLKWLG